VNSQLAISFSFSLDSSGQPENKCYYIIQRKATMYCTAIADGIMKRETKISDDPGIRKLANKQPNILETFSRSQAREKYKECLDIRCERRPRAGGAL
jgi:hypothetical protein